MSYTTIEIRTEVGIGTEAETIGNMILQLLDDAGVNTRLTCNMKAKLKVPLAELERYAERLEPIKKSGNVDILIRN